jgi:phosphoribosylformylglycinamidine synthase
LNIELELAAQNAVRELIRAGLIKSAHDCSEGGLAVALAESCFDPERLLGAHIDLGATESRVDQVLFNEAQSRIIISVAKDDENAALTLLKKRGVSATTIGVVVSEDIRISVKDQVLRWPIATLFDDWYFAIERVISKI